MKMSRWILMVFMAMLIGAGYIAKAGPSLPVTKPPVNSPLLLTGPLQDPPSIRGQWFVDPLLGAETSRSREFYDQPGGGSSDHNAITGYVDSVTFQGGPGSPITDFSIQATIFNDTTMNASWLAGTNSHGESLQTFSNYVGPLVETKLAVEFAIADTNSLPVQFTGPYRLRIPYIEALNEDQKAWYCWNPNDPAPEHKPAGGYFVPTWDFGTIPVGTSATRRLSFTIPGGLPILDTRYSAIMQSWTGTNDVLLNRTTSLKISTWIDEIAQDTGPGQEDPPLRRSNASVFHNEPGTDFGDAPDPTYPTLLANLGASHAIVPGIYLGATEDAEADGQPTIMALGDDFNGVDDEDGVTLPATLTIGQAATASVVASVDGFLWAWIDFDGNGSWLDPGEDVAISLAVTAGVNQVTFMVPGNSHPGQSYARFRFTTLQVPLLLPTGGVSDGEVEDYVVSLTEAMDWGDAFIPYPTLLANNGARHRIVPGVQMGALVDSEPDGQPTPLADGDDVNPPLGDDEDGVILPSAFIAGGIATVQVSVSIGGFLNAWIDFNANGGWADPGEQVFMNTAVTSGWNQLSVPVPPPPALVAGSPHSRWRFTTYPMLIPFPVGSESDGEVEDHEVHLEVLDFGDAPDPTYPTLLAGNGARHRIPSLLWMGGAPDFEGDGQPNPAATGDDLAGIADEDGIVSSGAYTRGSNMTVKVLVSTNGYLNAWVDFGQDGGWAEPGDQIITDQALGPSTNTVTFVVPLSAGVGSTYSRWRFASMSGLGFSGLAPDGEVEDHLITIYQDGPLADIVITNISRGVATNSIRVGWAGEPAVIYEAQFTTNELTLANPGWTGLGGYISNAPFVQIDPAAVESVKFYRVVAPFAPPPP